MHSKTKVSFFKKRGKGWKETELCKSRPLFVHHPLHCPPGVSRRAALWPHCAADWPGFACFFFLFFFIFFLILHHWSWRMLALVLSPRRIVTYGNAEDGDPGHYQVRGANSLMRTDDCVIVPVSHGHLFPFLDPIYQALGSFHDWWQWCYCCCPPAMCRR